MDDDRTDDRTDDQPGGGITARWRNGWNGRWRRLRATAEAGMSTAEYAVGTVAACAFAAVLYRVVTGDSIVSALDALVDRALNTLT
jgi:hypothetical protein